MSFAYLRCVYLGAASIPELQDAILNPLNPYLTRTTVPLDSCYKQTWTESDHIL